MIPDPIAALATPWGESAIAVIRTSGEGALALLDSHFRGASSLSDSPGHTMHVGTLVTDNRKIDQVVVSVYRRPRSYTGEESAEISCHGGRVIVRETLDLLYRAGFRQAQPGEFTMRAFLNGRIDLTRAEAVNEIIRARTDRARALALHRLEGSVQTAVNAAKSRLTDAKAALEIFLDYPDEDLPDLPAAFSGLDEVQDALEGLADSYATGKLVQDGATVAIAGGPNAGKSTLFNALLREERAIVSESPGTTRDYIEAQIEIDGIPVRLIDTAGMRRSEEPIEQEGVRRSERVIGAATLALYLIDGARGLTEEDRDLIEELSGTTRLLTVWNKVDLAPPPHSSGIVAVSAATGRGLADLVQALRARLTPARVAEDAEPVIDSDRQRRLLGRSAEAVGRSRAALAQGVPLDLISLDIDEALGALGEITGEVTSADVLERMFTNFCVGK